MKKITPGNYLHIIAPSESIEKVESILDNCAKKLQKELGILLISSPKKERKDILDSTSINHRTKELESAFIDGKNQAIISATGGYNSNELLEHINWNILKNNPKKFIGSSDITVLLNAIYAKTGIITYLGPNVYKFGMKYGLEYTLEYLKKCLMSEEPFLLEPSKKWSEDKWYRDQENRTFHENVGYYVINEGEATGTIIGGNLCSFNLLQGTEYLPKLEGSILFIEEDDLTGDHCANEFNRNLVSLLQQPGAKEIKGIVIGRFQNTSKVTLEKLEYIFKTKPNLKHIPVVANVDFGHTDPSATIPIGGKVNIIAKDNMVSIEIVEH